MGASAGALTIGAEVADPLIGLAITLVILRITWQSWATVQAEPQHDHEHGDNDDVRQHRR